MTPRPTVTHEIKLAAALEVAKNIDGDAETIASQRVFLAGWVKRAESFLPEAVA